MQLPAAAGRGLHMARVRVEQHQRLGEAAIGIGGDEPSGCIGNALGEDRQHQAGAGMGRLQALGILAIIEEGEIARARVGEGAHVLDHGVRGGGPGRQLRACRLGDVRQGERPGPLEESGMLHAVDPAARATLHRNFAAVSEIRRSARRDSRSATRYGGLLSTERATIRTSSPRRSGRSALRRRSLCVRTLAKSIRIGPTGEAHIKLAPTDERMDELSCKQTCAVDGRQPAAHGCARPPASHSEPASANTAPEMPRSSGTNGMGKRISAVVAQYIEPPSASPVFKSRGP